MEVSRPIVPFRARHMFALTCAGPDKAEKHLQHKFPLQSAKGCDLQPVLFSDVPEAFLPAVLMA